MASLQEVEALQEDEASKYLEIGSANFTLVSRAHEIKYFTYMSL